MSGTVATDVTGHSGPTQMNYEEAGDRWRGRNKTALVLRAAILISPIAASFATSYLASKYLPASSIGLSRPVSIAETSGRVFRVAT